MTVEQKPDGRWRIKHAGKEVVPDFATEAEAWRWADANVDDQVFDGPNNWSPALRYLEGTI